MHIHARTPPQLHTAKHLQTPTQLYPPTHPPVFLTPLHTPLHAPNTPTHTPLHSPSHTWMICSGGSCRGLSFVKITRSDLACTTSEMYGRVDLRPLSHVRVRACVYTYVCRLAGGKTGSLHVCAAAPGTGLCRHRATLTRTAAWVPVQGMHKPCKRGPGLVGSGSGA